MKILELRNPALELALRPWALRAVVVGPEASVRATARTLAMELATSSLMYFRAIGGQSR
jgi:hypothetical protein